MIRGTQTIDVLDHEISKTKAAKTFTLSHQGHWLWCSWDSTQWR